MEMTTVRGKLSGFNQLASRIKPAVTTLRDTLVTSAKSHEKFSTTNLTYPLNVEGDPRQGRALHDPPPKHAHRCPPLKNRAAPAMRRSQHIATSKPPPKVRRVIFFMVSIESTLNGGYSQTPRVSKTRLPSRRSLKRRRVFSRPVPGPLPGPRCRRTNRARRRWGKGPASGRAVESGRGRNRYRAFPSSPGAPFPGPP